MTINKRGQLLEKPFVHIFVVIVAALTLIFGFYLITNLLKTSNCSQLGLAVNDFQTTIDRYYHFDEGSSTEYNLKLPKRIKYVCFVNEGEIDTIVLEDIEKGLSKAFTGRNNFGVVPVGYCSKSFFKLDNLKNNEGTLCFANFGSIKFNLENKGEFVELSEL